MKNRLLILTIGVFTLCMTACKKQETGTEIKIDFTESYESAALALENAQKKYDEAVIAKNPEKIEAAKAELKIAQDKFVASKQTYVAQGGKVNSQYENVLKTSTQTLQKVTTPVENTQAISEKPAQTAEQVINKGVERIADNKITKTVSDVAQKAELNKVQQKVESEVKSTVNKTTTDIKKKTDDVKQSADKEINKVKQGLGNIFN